MFAKFLNKNLKKNEKSDSYDIVVNLIKEVLSEDISAVTISLDSKLEELGFDSIKFINLMLNLENYIEKDLEEIAEAVDLSELQTVNDIIILVDRLKSKV